MQNFVVKIYIETYEPRQVCRHTGTCPFLLLFSLFSGSTIIKRIGLLAGSEGIHHRLVFWPPAVFRSGPSICPSSEFRHSSPYVLVCNPTWKHHDQRNTVRCGAPQYSSGHFCSRKSHARFTSHDFARLQASQSVKDTRLANYKQNLSTHYVQI